MEKIKINEREKDAAAASLVGKIQDSLFAAALEKGISHKEIAERLDVDLSYVSSIFEGRQVLSLRSIAEISWAMGFKAAFTLKDKDVA